MVHALRRARQHLAPRGVLVSFLPRPLKRPHIVVTAGRLRQPVGVLINPVGESVLASAERAIGAVVEEGLFIPMGRRNDGFRVQLASIGQLDRYLRTGPRPPRFPSGARARLKALWRFRKQAARIEVTEYLTVIALRARAT